MNFLLKNDSFDREACFDIKARIINMETFALSPSFPKNQIQCDLVLCSAGVAQTILSQVAALAHDQSEKKALPSFSFRIFSGADDLQKEWAVTLNYPDLLLWDADLDLDLLAGLLTSCKKTPVVFLWGTPNNPKKEGEATKIQELPIQDFFPKPVPLGKFLSRLYAFAEYTLKKETAPRRLGPWLYVQAHRSLTDPETEFVQKLTDKETLLLDALLADPTPHSKESLLSDIWGYQSGVDTHTLETHIYNLRQKLTSLGVVDPDPFLRENGCYALHPAWRKD